MVPRLAGLVLAALAAAQADVPAPSPLPPRAWLPDDVLIAIETGDAGAAVGGLLDTLGAVPATLPETVRTEIALGLTAARLFLGEAPSELGRQLGGAGACLGIAPGDGKHPDLLLVLRPGDGPAAERFLARFPERVHWARDGDCLCAANTPAGRDRLLRQRAAGAGRWAEWPDATSASAAPAAPLRVFVDLDGLRARFPKNDPLAKIDAGGRVLLAPLLPALLAGHRLCAELHGGLSLRLLAKVTATADAAPWSALLAGGHRSRAILPPPDGALAVLALDRRLRTLFEEPERFLRAADVTKVQSFLSIADRLGGAGTSFTRDLLGGLDEPLTLYVLPATEPDDDQAPPLLLPAFALATAVRQARVEQVLQRALQAILLIANVERGQRHQAAFTVRGLHDAGDGVHGLVASLPEWRGPGLPPLEQGIEPALLFGHGHAVLATTAAAARALLEQAGAPARTELAGDEVVAFGAPVAAAMARNLQPLLLARMLDEGETEPAAARFFAIAQALLGATERLSLRVHAGADATTLELELRRRP